jgi:TolA-binding protein
MSPGFLLTLLSASALFIALASGSAGAQGTAATADAKDQQIRELREQVRKLEARLADLEKRVAALLARPRAADESATPEAPAAATVEPSGEASETAAAGAVGAGATEATRAQRDKLIARARQRMRRDQQKYTREQIAEAEGLYQVANANWRSDEAKESLRTMVKKFPDVNRTGCAVLYLGQMSEGEDREKLLTDAANKYADCFYGNGVQVGAYARYLLALHYRNLGQDEKSKQLFGEIRKKYPDAIGHRGELLAASIPKD